MTYIVGTKLPRGHSRAIHKVQLPGAVPGVMHEGVIATLAYPGGGTEPG